MANLFQQDGFIAWVPRVDDVNADPGILIRADNLLVDEKGALTLRPGSQTRYSGLGASINAMHSAILHPGGVPTQVDIYAADKNIYHGNTAIGQVGDAFRSEDVAIGSDLYDVFVARGSGRFRYDGEQVHNWGISRPGSAPTLAGSTPIAATVSTCASGESGGAFAANEGTGSFAAGFDGTANAAFSIVPNVTTGRAVGTKAFAAAQDFETILTYPGGDDDLIDCYVYMANPERIKTFDIIFGVGSDADPFQTDTYTFQFELGVPVSTKSNNPPAATAAAEGEGVWAEETPTPQQVANDFTAKRPVDPRNRIPMDYEIRGRHYGLPNYAESASPAWTHLSVPRGKFTRKGSTTGKNWTTVKAVRFAAQFIPGTTGEIRVDEIKVFGGGSRAFTGEYKCVLQAVVKRDDGVIVAKSQASDPSASVNVFQQSMTVTIANSVFENLDPSANELWLFMTGGGLDDWYRIATFPANPYANNIGLDEFDPNPEGTIDQDDQARGLSRDFTWPDNVSNPDLTVTLANSELDALIENVKLERGLTTIPDNIIDIAGPYQFRQVMLDANGVLWLTGVRSPGTVSVYNTKVIDPEPIWLEQTSSGLYVGTRRDVYRVYGDGTQIDAYNINIGIRALGVPHPPIDRCVWTYGDAIIYRSSDGLVMLTGDSVQIFPTEDIEPLWRGFARHGVPALNTQAGKFRLCVDNQILYMTAPEGDDTEGEVIYRYSFVTRKWSRTIYPWVITSLDVDVNGGAVAGTADGRVVDLDYLTQDDVADIPFLYHSRYDSSNEPLSFKDAFDVQVGMDTGSRDVTVTLVKEDGTTSTSYTGSTDMYQVWRANAADFGPFRGVQVRIQGTSYKFVLRHFDISFRNRPQHMMMLDTGYVSASKQGDLAWFKELEITCKSGSNLTVTPYFDDVAQADQTVVVTPNVVTTYRVVLPRGSVGYKARFKIATTAADGSNDPGFECYSVRMRLAPTGNATTSSIMPVYPMAR